MLPSCSYFRLLWANLSQYAPAPANTMYNTETTTLRAGTPIFIFQRYFIIQINPLFTPSYPFPQPSPKTCPILPCCVSTDRNPIIKSKKTGVEMQQIQSVAGRLLYLTHKLFLEKKISVKEKGVLKDLIIGDNKQIHNIYEKYLQEGTELTLSSDLLHLLRLEKDNQTEEASSQGSKKPKRGPITINIPKRNIQKLPNIQGRI